MDFIPEFAPCLGIDACRGFIQHQKAGSVHDAGGQRQPLLPAARERPGKLALARGEAKVGQRVGNRFSGRIKAVKTGDKVQVLFNRQVFIEGKALGHVADLALDRGPFAADVVAQHLPLAAVGGQKAAHQPDRRGLA